MKHDSRPLGTLALSSLRQNRGLLLLSTLTLTFLMLLGWALTRLLEEENAKVRFHFTRLETDIRKHETYLLNVAEQFRHTSPGLPGGADLEMRQALQPGQGRQLYRASWLSVSLPFTLAFDEHHALSDMDASIDIAVRLAAYYSHYWSGSEYKSPQVLLFTQDPLFHLTLPASDPAPQAQNDYLKLIDYRRQRLITQQNFFSDSRVRWVSSDNTEPHVLTAVIRMNMPDQDAEFAQLGMLTSRLDLDQLESLQRVMERPIYDQFTLIAPSGDVLMGSLDNDRHLPEDLSMDRHGIHFKISGSNDPRWSGVYLITYANFLRLAKWPLLGALAILLASFACAWLANRWYSARIVRPAQLAHQRLVESQRFITDVIDNAPTGLSIVRRNDRQTLLENQNARHWGGTNELLDLIEDQSMSTEFCMQVNNRYLQAFSVPTRYRGDEVLLCAFIDITQHRNDNTALAQAKLIADQASEAKTLFLATMSHEIRTPLYGVLGNLELLALTELNPRQRSYLQTIQSASASLSALISDVLDVSKIEAGQVALEPAPFEPRELAQACLDAIAPQASAKGLELDIGVDPRLPNWLLGDPARLRQIIANLLTNALKFTTAGRISLRLSVLEQNNEQTTVSWQVTDTGIGIAQARQTHLFEPFYQVPGSSQEGGAGLGLSICASLSELMGGKLRVASELGLGSSFFLEVPLAILPNQQVTRGPVSSLSNPLYLRALVAEDNPINRAILQEQLGTLGVQVVTAANGEEALQRWQPGEFDLIITDVNMPRVNGYELASRLRQSGVSVPIIGVTANALREEGQRCLAVGMDAWVVKPLGLGNLRAILLRVCPHAEVVPEPTLTTTATPLDLHHMPPSMISLFVDTMSQDLANAHKALSADDNQTLVQYLHSMSGAYSVVCAMELADECAALETLITEQGLTPILAARVDSLLQHLLDALPPRPS